MDAQVAVPDDGPQSLLQRRIGVSIMGWLNHAHDLVTTSLAAFGEFRRTHVEMYERHHILLEPWTHDRLHWGADGTLHGVVADDRGRPPVTRSGWCACRPLDVD